MERKSFTVGVEAMTGAALIVLGLGAHVIGEHGVFAIALAPFGIGLILSDLAGCLARRRRD